MKTNGTINEVTKHARQRGILKLKLSFKTFYLSDTAKKYEVKDGVIIINMNKEKWYL